MIHAEIHADDLRILHYPQPVLRQIAAPVPEVTEHVRQIALRMIELMHEAPGVGLAAPQVGLPWRLFVANATGDPGDDKVFINPTLSDPSRDTHLREEGCLSLPGVNGEITRPSAITITATDLDGDNFRLTASGLEARIWQHEVDHLDGVLIIDRMSRIDRTANKRLLRDMEHAAT